MSEGGNDGEDGESAETAWRTPARVNAAALTSDHTVLFERGGTYIGELTTVRYTVGAYGVGAAPSLANWAYLDDAGSWSLHAAGVWKIALSNPNVGYLLADDAIKGARVWDIDNLSGDWDFYCDATHLYVKLATNPADATTDLRAAVDGRLVQVANGAVVEDIEVTGVGGHGFAGKATDVTIRNCKIGPLGGGQLFGTTRYGNGIETYIGSADWVVEDNEISECYDAAYTAQGIQSGANRGWSNILVQNNDIHDNGQSVEFWSTGTDGEGFVNVAFIDNDCTDAGRGWASDLRPDQSKRVHVLTYNMDLPADIEISGNTFHRSGGAYRYSAEATPGLVSSNNDIALEGGHLMQYQTTETIEQAAAWATANSTEAGSTFTVL